MKTFPMFLTVAGRRVVIAGGGEQAAQKARLMLKTEAKLTLLAPSLEDELAALVAAGRAEHDPTQPSAESFRDAALVFVATGCTKTDRALHALAKSANALVNVVDRPDLSDAFTPSIVDRDPVVVAIGTEGTAPVLAREIRARIEAMLEPRLGELAALAGRLRGAVARHIPAPSRRAFWAWVFAETPRRLHAAGHEREAAKVLKRRVEAGGYGATTSLISLVGAGPGARDLLTLRAVQRLQQADVIFYDRLVDPEVLDLARRDAERFCVGKEVGRNAWPQERINGVVLAAAAQGKRVVRLKSGDPGIFGRAAEEIAAAKAAGIAVEIVPGITAAAAAAASLGRPLTERGRTDRLVLATGTLEASGVVPDYTDVLTPGTTLALYMAMHRLAELGNRLLAAGQPPELEVEIVSRATRVDECRKITTLSEIAAAEDDKRLPSPAIVFIRKPKSASTVAMETDPQKQMCRNILRNEWRAAARIRL